MNDWNEDYDPPVWINLLDEKVLVDFSEVENLDSPTRPALPSFFRPISWKEETNLLSKRIAEWMREYILE